MPATRECELRRISRSTAYYRLQTVPSRDLALMGELDRIHLEYPFYGARRLCDELADRGHGAINRECVQRLMATVSLAAPCSKRRRLTPGIGHKIYLYRLRELTIHRPNQVWATDIS